MPDSYPSFFSSRVKWVWNSQREKIRKNSDSLLKRNSMLSQVFSGFLRLCAHPIQIPIPRLLTELDCLKRSFCYLGLMQQQEAVAVSRAKRFLWELYRTCCSLALSRWDLSPNRDLSVGILTYPKLYHLPSPVTF